AALLRMTPDEFDRRFRHTPLARPGRAGLLRNAATVLGNSGDAGAVPALADALNDAEPLVRGAAAWALGRLGGEAPLRERLACETDEYVRGEIENALEALSARSVVSPLPGERGRG
ncbi:MAG TPA: HEAT repeat domain-containing protein, partial [Planctomycetaceae bacterium]